MSFAVCSYAQLPYNPDSNNDQIINSGDLTSFLSFFGSSFLPEGVVDIASGGTSASNLDDARANLLVSLFKDSMLIINTEEVPFGWVDAGFRATGNVATGFETVATGDFSTAQGYGTDATGNFSHSQNRFTTASGICSHAEGEGGTASGTASHAEGFGTLATSTGSHAEGYQTDALSTAAHAEGYQTTAQGQYSHAEGRGNTAAGTSSHAEGQNTSATGLTAHAEGNFTVASGARSHAGGFYTVADQDDQTSIGKYNETGQVGALFTIGNGESQLMRNDAFRVMNDGSAYLDGQLDVNGPVISNGQDLNQLITDLQAENAAQAILIQELQDQVQALIDAGITAPSEQ